MKLFFTDAGGKSYSFDFDSYGRGKIEIDVYRDPPRETEREASTIRTIVNNRVLWAWDDEMYLSDDAKQYCERLARLSVFH
jgi:hypothetical protein